MLTACQASGSLSSSSNQPKGVEMVYFADETTKAKTEEIACPSVRG